MLKKENDGYSDKTEDFLSIDYEKNKKYILLDLEKNWI